MSLSEMETEICDLEDAYAEALKDSVDTSTLNSIWIRIKALRKEIGQRRESKS